MIPCAQCGSTTNPFFVFTKGFYAGKQYIYCRICTRANSKAYYESHRVKRLKRIADYHKEQGGVRLRYLRERYRKHPEKQRAAQVRYVAAHPDRYRALCIARNNRRRKRCNQGGNFTAQEWHDLKTRYNYICLRCRRREPEVRITPDHIMPLSKGGSNTIDNIQPLCLSCNCSKYTDTIDYRPKQEAA